MTTNRPATYRIFLLTFWLEDADDLADPERWRFRLEKPKSRSRQGCVGLTALTARLIREIGDGEDLAHILGARVRSD